MGKELGKSWEYSSVVTNLPMYMEFGVFEKWKIFQKITQIKLKHLVLPKGAHTFSDPSVRISNQNWNFLYRAKTGKHFLCNPCEWLICKVAHLIYPVIWKSLNQGFKKVKQKFLLLIFKSGWVKILKSVNRKSKYIIIFQLY